MGKNARVAGLGKMFVHQNFQLYSAYNMLLLSYTCTIYMYISHSLCVLLGAANLTTSLGAHQRRPLSESLSAPGFQQQQQQQQQGGSAAGVGGALSADITQQYETLLRQFNLQNQQLLLQGHHLQQHYLEQQQRYT